MSTPYHTHTHQAQGMMTFKGGAHPRRRLYTPRRASARLPGACRPMWTRRPHAQSARCRAARTRQDGCPRLWSRGRGGRLVRDSPISSSAVLQVGVDPKQLEPAQRQAIPWRYPLSKETRGGAVTSEFSSGEPAGVYASTAACGLGGRPTGGKPSSSPPVRQPLPPLQRKPRLKQTLPASMHRTHA